MSNEKFYRLGQFIYRLRWPIVVLWLVMIGACLPLMPTIISPFKTTGFIDQKSESTQTQQDLDNSLGYSNHNKFLILYKKTDSKDTQPISLVDIKHSLLSLKNFSLKHDIILPSGLHQFSKDKRAAVVVVIFPQHRPLSEKQLAQFKSAIKVRPNMTAELGGEAIFVENVNKQTQTDLYNADFVATPVAIVVLLIVFGSVVAALLPIILGGGCALIILAILYFLGHIMTLSIFTLNIALLLGLCLSLDYALFIISRFRDELAINATVDKAIATTHATAGKAIFFSGLAVFASLSGLLLFPINILFSVAIGGLVAVSIAVFNAIVLLPAILSILGPKINLLSISFIKKKANNRFSFWHQLATRVVKYPLSLFFGCFIFLLLLGSPLLFAKFGVSDFRIFPKQSIYRQFFDTYMSQFANASLNPILLVVKSTNKPILARTNLAKLSMLVKHLKANPLIGSINSIVTVDKQLTTNSYYQLYHAPASTMTDDVKELLATTTRSHMTMLTINSPYAINSPELKKLIQELRHLKPIKGLSWHITGTPVNNYDILKRIAYVLPWAILWVIGFTYIILLVLLRSLFLPAKAILMNILSLSACYGALVLVIQTGYLHQWLNFDPQGMLDISLVVIIFCAIFGFSMDYEVFLLTRIKEAYEESQDNEKSIIFGLEKSSRLITSAAIIVIFICSAFLVADILMVKAFGLGIAVAVFVDAFLIRTVFVPVTMTLVKSWNWYLPQWLDKILPKL